MTKAQMIRWHNRTEEASEEIDNADSELRRARKMLIEAFPDGSPNIIDALNYVEDALGCLRGATVLVLSANESIRKERERTEASATPEAK